MTIAKVLWIMRKDSEDRRKVREEAEEEERKTSSRDSRCHEEGQ